MSNQYSEVISLYAVASWKLQRIIVSAEYFIFQLIHLNRGKWFWAAYLVLCESEVPQDEVLISFFLSKKYEMARRQLHFAALLFEQTIVKASRVEKRANGGASLKKKNSCTMNIHMAYKLAFGDWLVVAETTFTRAFVLVVRKTPSWRVSRRGIMPLVV